MGRTELEAQEQMPGRTAATAELRQAAVLAVTPVLVVAQLKAQAVPAAMVWLLSNIGGLNNENISNLWRFLPLGCYESAEGYS
jgi:hypothetical protein